VLRGLRAAAAPVYRGGPRCWSVDAIHGELGPAPARRLFEVPAIAVAGTEPARQLWLHSLATACACRDLARRSGLLPPDHAYLLGLLHDLPRWLDLLGRHASGQPPAGTASDWFAHWQLPRPLHEVLTRREAVLDRATVAPGTALTTAGETLAEFAGFHHPDEQPAADALLAGGEHDLAAAQRLRQEVEGLLRAHGLDPALRGGLADGDGDLEEDRGGPFGRRHRGTLDEAVLDVLHRARHDAYRSVTAALAAAVVRCGAVDRVFCLRWNDARECLILRALADGSARRGPLHTIRPSADECAALRRSLREERPVRLDLAMGDTAGLLAELSADEVLAVPLNRQFATPSFLVLDRSLSLQPIQLLAEAGPAATLGLTGSLLTENLLLRRRRRRANQYALTDPLTRLFNRRMGLQALDQEVARAMRSRRCLTVMLCDLDYFKRLNDTYGHLQGDQALRSVADVLRRTLRKSDTVCRFGGEEFLVVLPETAADDAAVLAARLFTAIEACGKELGLPLTVSIGLTTLRADDTAEALLHRADHALYASKGTGRNRFSADIEDPEAPVPSSGTVAPEARSNGR
ncbi:MAG: diguanylate cyclase, partial [Planctomycetes bacterium]|nr:diguanylate cyclase [Planctomycetota bacterium]